MASTDNDSNKGAVNPDEPGFEYKGHPQPPLNERLEAAQIFLAEEDEYRCLDFDAKLLEIDELVEHIEKEKLAHDATRLRDVKIKARTHHERQKYVSDRLPDTDPCKVTRVRTFSTRLMNAEVASAYKEGREEMGYVSQMRDDHPPFTVERPLYQQEFLAELRKDAAAEPALVKPSSNLFWAEDDAYKWAMEDPALIPHWMHPTAGIQKSGTDDKDVPWYRKPPPPPSAKAKPARAWVPSYLLILEKKINALLKADYTKDPKIFQSLIELLRFVEPARVREPRVMWEHFEEINKFLEFDSDEQAERKYWQAKYWEEESDWIHRLAASGVFFIVVTPGQDQVLDEGVFYVSDGMMSKAKKADLDLANQLLQKLLKGGKVHWALSIHEEKPMNDLLYDSLPEAITDFWKERYYILRKESVSSWHDLPTQELRDYADKLEKQACALQEEWLSKLNNAEFRYLRPGEIRENAEGILYLPWEPTPSRYVPVNKQLDLPIDVRGVQKTLRAYLKDGVIPALDDVSPENQDILTWFLKVAYPQLRVALGAFLELQLKKNKDKLTPAETSQLDRMTPLVTNYWKAWVYGLGSEIEVRMPTEVPKLSPENPAVLYYHRHVTDSRSSEPEHDAETRAHDLTRALASSSQNDQFFLDLIDPLMEFMPSTLSGTYLQHTKDVRPGDRKRVNKTLYKTGWGNLFRRWVETKRNRLITIKPEYDSHVDPSDNPSVVYYRAIFDSDLAKVSAEEGLGRSLRNIDKVSDATKAKLPDSLRDALDQYQKTHDPGFKALFEWLRDQWLPSTAKDEPPRTPPFKDTIFDAVPTTGPTPPTYPDSEDEHTNPPLTKLRSRRPLPSAPAGEEPSSESPLNVDFGPLMRQIRAIEDEINRLLLQRRLYREKRTLYPEENSKLLRRLLAQFLPDKIQRLRSRTDAIAEQLSSQAGKTLLWGDEDFREQSTEYSKALERWIDSVTDTHVRIKTMGKAAQAYGETVLSFNPAVTGVGSNFRLTDAATQHPPAPPTPSSPERRNIYSTYQRQLRQSADMINRLLKKYREHNVEARGVESLEWDGYEQLLAHLRNLMPSDLQILDEKLTALDDKARDKTRTLTNEEILSWFTLWDTWNREYREWLSRLPENIKIGDKYDQDDDSILEVQVDNWSITTKQRSRSIPTPVTTIENRLNQLLRDPASFTDGQALIQFDRLLHPLHRPVGQRLRRKLLGYIKANVCKDPASDPEAQAILEACLAASFIIWVFDLANSPQSSLRISEPQPGAFTLDMVTNGVPGDLVDRAEEESEEVFNQFFSATLGPWAKTFYEEAGMLRTAVRPNARYPAKLQADISRILLPEFRLLAQTLSTLTKTAEDDLSAPEKRSLIDAFTRLSWYFFGEKNPEIRSRVSRTPSENAGNLLVGPKLAGHRPPPELPTLPFPNEFRIKEVEIELNNLLYKYGAKTITDTEAKELRFLLQALLPYRLKRLKQGMDNITKKHVVPPGANFKEGMTELEAAKIFDGRFQEFLRTLSSRRGIFLDNYWYSPEEIAEAVSRGEQWKALSRGADGSPTFPSTADHIQNSGIQEIHDLYGDLRSFIDNGCKDDAEAERSLFLKQIPERLIELKEAVRTHEANQPGKVDIDNVIMLDQYKSEFLEAYLRWFSEQSAEQIRGLKDQAAKAAPIKIDFTPMAERRGIQRAAIELALNLLATNQEQHRPHDRFREVDLPGQLYEEPEEDVPLALPLEPSRRPLEQDPWAYTKKLRAYREWKDHDFSVARERIQFSRDGLLPTPVNFVGPYASATGADVKKNAADRSRRLAHISGRLLIAKENAPRPIIQELLLLYDQGLADSFLDKTSQSQDQSPAFHSHILYDQEKLTLDNEDLLNRLTEQSWHEPGLPTGADRDRILAQEQIIEPEDRAMFDQFEKDIQEIYKFGKHTEGPREHGEIPFWTPESAAASAELDPDDEGRFWQPEYDPSVSSTMGVSPDTIEQALNDYRNLHNCELIDGATVRRYLRALNSLRVLSFNNYLVSLIPHNGHPENSYITSTEDILRNPGLRRVEDGRHEVQYDALGTVGPLMIQPNKYHHLRRIAFRLGRDVMESTLVNSDNEDKPVGDRVAEQRDAYVDAWMDMRTINPAQNEKITLQRLARDLLKVAPDLADELEIEPEQVNGNTRVAQERAAKVLEMQILQEVNNKWEFKFPEGQKFWEFAAPRIQSIVEAIGTGDVLAPREVRAIPIVPRFFDIRRWPVCLQTQEDQTAIQRSGPIIQDPIPMVEEVTSAPEDQQRREERKRKRHYNGVPWFPFGETPYQAAWQSHRMEEDLKDVPEFQPAKKARTGLFSWFRRDPTTTRTPSPPPPTDLLPSLPDTFKASSISVGLKRAQMLRHAQKLPGFPDATKIPEFYYTPDEINYLTERAKERRDLEKIAEANKFVEKRLGKRIEQATFAEVDEARRDLKIDTWTEMPREDTPPAERMRRAEVEAEEEVKNQIEAAKQAQIEREQAKRRQEAHDRRQAKEERRRRRAADAQVPQGGITPTPQQPTTDTQTGAVPGGTAPAPGQSTTGGTDTQSGAAQGSSSSPRRRRRSQGGSQGGEMGGAPHADSSTSPRRSRKARVDDDPTDIYDF